MMAANWLKEVTCNLFLTNHETSLECNSRYAAVSDSGRKFRQDASEASMSESQSSKIHA